MSLCLYLSIVLYDLLKLLVLLCVMKKCRARVSAGIAMTMEHAELNGINSFMDLMNMEVFHQSSKQQQQQQCSSSGVNIGVFDDFQQQQQQQQHNSMDAINIDAFDGIHGPCRFLQYI